MLNCPICQIGLDRAKTREGTFFACKKCGGNLVPFSLVRQAVSPRLVDDIVRSARAQLQRTGRRCPSCNNAMAVVKAEGPHRSVPVDVCTSCEAVWLDRGEFDAMCGHGPAAAAVPPPLPASHAARPASPPAPLKPSPAVRDQAAHVPPATKPVSTAPAKPAASAAGAYAASHTNPAAASTARPAPAPAPKPAARPVAAPASSQARPQMRPLTPRATAAPRAERSAESQHVANLAKLQAEEAGRENRVRARNEQLDRRADISLTPDEPWHWAPGAMGLPVVSGEPKPKTAPVLTVLLAAGMSILFVSLMMQGQLAAAIADWGFIPSRLGRHNLMTIFTSFALHVSVWHLVANMYFLVIFGRNVEDNLGRMKFLLMLVLGHVAGAMLHMLCDPRPDLPLVGASAGISSVIAYYGVMFPNARIGIMWRLLVVVGPWLRLPAFGALVLFVIVQLAGTVWQVYGFSEVSYLGHLGGIVVGLAAALTARIRQNAAEFAAPKLA